MSYTALCSEKKNNYQKDFTKRHLYRRCVPTCLTVNIKPCVLVSSSLGSANMARGHQKIQSQQKNAKKQAEMKKAKGHDQKTAAKAALVFTCAVCRVSRKLRLSLQVFDQDQ